MFCDCLQGFLLVGSVLRSPFSCITDRLVPDVPRRCCIPQTSTTNFPTFGRTGSEPPEQTVPPIRHAESSLGHTGPVEFRWGDVGRGYATVLKESLGGRKRNTLLLDRNGSTTELPRAWFRYHFRNVLSVSFSVELAGLVDTKSSVQVEQTKAKEYAQKRRTKVKDTGVAR